MAAIPPARTRSLRAAAPSLNRHQQSSNNASSTTMATATATRRTQAGPESSIQGPSPLSLFMTNLRLLDLDLLPDWPGISAATFSVTGSGTGAAQAQKRRVICVEWALFRLFEIYDAEETRTKLKPFFPPQEQVQSVNLRAALLRGLEAAKKSGVLGKDTILRKTMLDDCRGERLEEVLAAFSTAVLKMVVAEEESMGSSTPAMRLALEGRGYKDDKTDLLVLGLVYRAALNRTLRARNETAAKFRDFEDLLSVKERGVKRRKEEAKALNDVERAQRGNAASKDAAREMRQTVRNNWAGNEQWMDALMYGDAKGRGDDGGPFGMPFERVWRRVEQSRLEELEEGGVGLLEQLERRVRGHEERLAKWERFRDGLRVSTRGPPREKQKVGEDEKGSKGLNLGFGAHESLQVGGVGEKSRGKSVVRLPQAGTTTRHDKFIKDLERDLEQASGTATNPIEALSFLFDRKPAPKATGSLKAPDAEHEASSEISDLEDHDVLNGRHVDDEFSKPIEPRKLEALKTFPVRPKLNYASASALARNSLEDEGEIEAPKKEPLTKSAPKLSRPRTMSSSGEEAQDAPRALPTRTRTMSISRSRTYTRDRSISPEEYQQPEQHIPEYKEEVDTRRTQQKQHMLEDVVVHDDQQPEPISPTQDLADEILENMENASPSPAKPSRPRHKLSLAERTRMSMARGSLLFADDEDQDLEISPHKQASSPSEPLPSTNGEESEPSPPEDLVSRTRRSMAGFEKARQKAQLDRRRSIRKSKAMGPPIKEGSYFPKVHEEEGQSILAEELIGEEDMEAVFKSRPKIKASPIPSPTREWDDD